MDFNRRRNRRREATGSGFKREAGSLLSLSSSAVALNEPCGSHRLGPFESGGRGEKSDSKIDRDLPIDESKTMQQLLAESNSGRRFNMLLLTVFAVVALVLAMVGIYGVMSYTVTQRTHEIGIRVAIGAQPRDVFRMVIGQGMMLAMIGVAFGLVGAFGLTRLMTTMLFGVEPTDPATFIAIAVLLSSRGVGRVLHTGASEQRKSIHWWRCDTSEGIFDF